MKHFIIIIIVALSLSCMGQISYNPARKLVYVRTSNVAHKKPPITQVGEYTWAYNSADSILYKGENGIVVAFARLFPYSAGAKKEVRTSTNDAVTYTFPAIRKMYYILYDTIRGNLPILADFPTSIYQCINTTDSLWYDKYNGVVRKAKVFFPYSEYANEFITRIYVAPYGDDVSKNPHNQATPYKTVYTASVLAVASDTIILLPGTFTETAQSNIRAGVIIKGQGIGVTNVVSSYTYAPAPSNVSYALFTLKSTTLTNGNQTISGISFYGNSTCYRAISVYKRNNVTIRDCSFNNFKGSATIFYNDANNNVTQPAAYASGNQFINNTVTNCTSYGISYAGALTLLAQQNATVSGNVMIDERRSDTGYTLISGLSNRKINIYNNTFKKATKYLTYWPFTIEMRYNHGEISFYNNISEGVVDITYNFKQLLAFGLNIYGNTFGSNLPGVHQIGLELEADNRGVRVYDNIFKNLEYGMSITTNINTASLVDSVAITRNLFANIGYPATRFTGGAIRMSGSTTYTAIPQYRNVMITNNTIVGNGYAVAGIWLQRKGYYDDFKVTNNIIYNFDLSYGGVYLDKDAAQTMTVDSLAMNYNLVYLTGNTNNPKYLNITPSNTTYLNTVKSDPMLNSGYQLLPGSPAIGTGFGGINIGKY